jgi:hypothetical protein
MLYPIELLGHGVGTHDGANGTACMVPACHCFVMSSLTLSAVVHRPTPRVPRVIVQFATVQNDIIAMCNAGLPTIKFNYLILNVFFIKERWHAPCNIHCKKSPSEKLHQARAKVP